MRGLFQLLTDQISEQLKARFHPYEVRNSLLQIALRWQRVLTDNEKQKIARTLGGNRYAKTTYTLLDALFSDIVAEYFNEDGTE